MTTFPSLIRCVSSSGVVRYRLGDPLVDRYLEFVAGRARPNTLRAVAFDLKTFFTVVAKDPVEVARRTCSSSSHTSAATGRWCGWLIASRACRRGRSRDGCRRCRGSMRMRSRAVTRRCGSIRCRVGCPPVARRGAPVAHGAVGAGAADAAEDPVARRRWTGWSAALRTERDRAMVSGDGVGRAAPLRGARPAVIGCAGRRSAGVHRRGQGRTPPGGAGRQPVLRRARRLFARRTATTVSPPIGCSWC